MGPSISTTMLGPPPLPRGDYPRVASKIATKEKNGPKYVRRVQSASRSGGGSCAADWVGAAVGREGRSGARLLGRRGGWGRRWNLRYWEIIGNQKNNCQAGVTQNPARAWD